MIPNWLARYANENDLLEIEKAVGLAEAHTSGEIVPMIVRESSMNGHVPYIVTLLWFAFFMVSLPTLILTMHLPGPDWLLEIGAAVLSCVIGWSSARLPAVRRMFTPVHDQAQSVFHRAQLEFHQTGIPATAGKTGVLIFVSLHERRAVILGDQAISEHIKPEAWLEIVSGLLEQMRHGEMRVGFTTAIAKIGEVLAKEFPALAHEKNELPNTLIVKE